MWERPRGPATAPAPATTWPGHASRGIFSGPHPFRPGAKPTSGSWAHVGHYFQALSSIELPQVTPPPGGLGSHWEARHHHIGSNAYYYWWCLRLLGVAKAAPGVSAVHGGSLRHAATPPSIAMTTTALARCLHHRGWNSTTSGRPRHLGGWDGVLTQPPRHPRARRDAQAAGLWVRSPPPPPPPATDAHIQGPSAHSSASSVCGARNM